MPRRSVLFVCVANSCRSQMAEAAAKALGQDAWDVWSAGSSPSGRVHPVALQVMGELGLDLSVHRSKGLDAVPAGPWDYVVTMGCSDACDRGGHPAPQAGSPTGVPNTEGVRPAVAARHRLEWEIPDPVGLPLAEVRRIRDDVIQRVGRLLGASREEIQRLLQANP